MRVTVFLMTGLILAIATAACALRQPTPSPAPMPPPTLEPTEVVARATLAPGSISGAIRSANELFPPLRVFAREVPHWPGALGRNPGRRSQLHPSQPAAGEVCADRLVLPARGERRLHFPRHPVRPGWGCHERLRAGDRPDRAWPRRALHRCGYRLLGRGFLRPDQLSSALPKSLRLSNHDLKIKYAPRTISRIAPSRFPSANSCITPPITETIPRKVVKPLILILLR